MMNFTNDELNLMCIYQRETRKELITALTEMRGYLDTDEAELRELTDSAIGKLETITDEQFAEMELVPDFDAEEQLNHRRLIYAILLDEIICHRGYILKTFQNIPPIP